MQLVLAQNVRVKREWSVLSFKDDPDGYELSATLLLPVNPRLVFEDANQARVWKSVTSILSGMSWNLRFSLKVKRFTSDMQEVRLSMCTVGNIGSRRTKNFMKYFKRKLVSENIAVRRFEVEENKLISLTVEGYKEDEFNSADDVFLVSSTKGEACKLIMSDETEIRMSWTESLDENITCNQVSGYFLETGMFTNLKLVSNQGVTIKCHRAVLIDGSPRLRDDILRRRTRTPVNLSTAALTAFVHFLYFGTVTQGPNYRQLYVELMNAAQFYEVPTLRDELSINLMREENLDAATACGVIQHLIRSGRFESYKELGTHLFKLISRKSAEDAIYAAIAHEFVKDLDFFQTWNRFMYISGN